MESDITEILLSIPFMGYIVGAGLILSIIVGYFQFPLWDTSANNKHDKSKQARLSIPFMGY